MIALFASIICSTLIMLLFKSFKFYRVNTFQAIVANYFTAAFLAYVLSAKNSEITTTLCLSQQIPWALFLGSLFIVLFFTIGIATQKVGINPITIAMKLAYIFPVLLAFSFYNETLSYTKWVGIFLTFIAVILSSIKKATFNKKDQISTLAISFLIFLGSGICDAVVQYCQKSFFINGGFIPFLNLLFLTAGLIGVCTLIIKSIYEKKWTLSAKNILAGILLGIPNYGSLHFFIQALDYFHPNSSFVFPVNNIGIVVLSTFLAIVLFKEKLSIINFLGFVFAIVSIFVISSEYLF